jgi:hypothetical protein
MTEDREQITDNWLCFALFFRRSAKAFILIIFCVKELCINLTFKKIGFVLHNHSGHQGIRLPGIDYQSIGLSGRSFLITWSADILHPDFLII